MLVLGIDQGTTGTRVTVVEPSGRVVAHAYRGHRTFVPAPGWVEQDPAEIMTAVEELVYEMRTRADPISAIGIANQGETVLAWDRRTGKPLHNAIGWQDTRTQPEMDRLARDPEVARRVTEITGLRLDAYFSASKMAWLLDHVDGARAMAERGDLCLGTLDAWMIWNLTQSGDFVTDMSTAARTLLFDLRRFDYDPWLLELFGIPRRALAEVRACVDDFGVYSREQIPIVVSMVDQPAAMIGQGCLRPGTVKATFGTGCFVYLNTGTRPAPSPSGLLTTLAWYRSGVPTYALDGGVFAAGSVVDWMRDQLGLFADARELDGLVAQSTQHEVVCVPALAGLGPPTWARQTRGLWAGLGLGTSRADLARAALEGIAYQVSVVVRAMSNDGGLSPTRLRVDGGLTRCESLMQMQADLLGLPVEVSHEPEATSLGVCWLAARTAGLIESDEAMEALAHADKTYEPRMTDVERTERIARLDAVERAARELA